MMRARGGGMRNCGKSSVCILYTCVAKPPRMRLHLKQP